MTETCAVCRKGKGPEKCEVCGFSDNGVVNRTFLIREDAINWIETVVKPYRTQWEARLAAQVEDRPRPKHTLRLLRDPQWENFTDHRDGKVYKTVKIGDQIWMAENLNYNAPGSQCYNYKYGRLYDRKTALKVCPAGWHLPDDDEWQTLFDFVGGIEIAGKKLKTRKGWNLEEERPKNFIAAMRAAMFQEHNEFNGNGEDAYGFSALPGGYGNFTAVIWPDFIDFGGGHIRYSDEERIKRDDGYLIMRDVGCSGYWWSKGRHLKDIHGWKIDRTDNVPYKCDLRKSYLLSVRCVQNNPKIGD